MTNEEKAKQTAVELCGQHTAGSYTYLQTEKAALKVLEQDREQTELTQKIIEFETELLTTQRQLVNLQIHKMEKNEAIMLKAIMQEHTHQVKNILESFTAKIEI